MGCGWPSAAPPPLPPEALAVAPAAWGIASSRRLCCPLSFCLPLSSFLPAYSQFHLPLRFGLIVCLCEFVFRFARIRLRVLVRPLSSRLTFRLRLGLPRFARFPICFSWGGRPFVSGGGASGLLPRGSAFCPVLLGPCFSVLSSCSPVCLGFRFGRAERVDNRCFWRELSKIR